MEWFAVYSSGILRGSMCNADDTTQIIWVKYLAMANEAHDPNSGRLEFKKGDPYPIEYIATQCRKTVDDIIKAEHEFMADINKSDGLTPRLIIEPDGTRVLSNWSIKQNRKNKICGNSKKTQTEKNIDAASYAKKLMQVATKVCPEVVNDIVRDKYLDNVHTHSGVYAHINIDKETGEITKENEVKQ